jgi:hypothetical protein
MKKLISLIFLGLYALSTAFSQDITTVEAKSIDISDNLDLEAVASIFGDAKDLEDFENKLNDPYLRISNLDLNGDGQVDYLRVVETSENNVHVVAIQAVIGRDQFQDVAIISVEKDSRGTTTVQVVGDVYMYGPDYIIQPVYVQPPVIYVWFWGPRYNPWHSPYYYGYYPSYYRPWNPYPPYQYRNNVYVHVNVNNSYHRTSVRTSNTSVKIQQRNRSNDYGRSNPNRSFEKRNEGIKNRAELTNRRASANTPSTRESRDSKNRTSTGRAVQQDWKPASERNNNQARPANRDNSRTDARTVTRENNRQETKPVTRDNNNQRTNQVSRDNKSQRATPAQKPASTRQSTKPTSTSTRTKPAAKPASKSNTSNRTTSTKRDDGGRR